MNLTERVEAALGRAILPSVIARGATVRVAAVEAGVATLEVAGSPGAVYPLAARMEALIRAAVPEVTALRLVPPGHGPAGVPGVPGEEDGWIRVRLEGGCQGCSLAEVTLRQGIEPVLRARLPGMTGLVDVTDHEAGAEPFFSP